MMLRARFFLAALCGLLWGSLAGQEAPAAADSTTAAKTVPGFAPAGTVVKLSVASLFSVPPGLQFGAEYFVAPRLSLYSEAGYLFSNWFGLYDRMLLDKGRLNGTRLRQQFRWYYAALPGRYARGEKSAFFAGVDVFYKFTDHRRLEWRDAMGGSYQERLEIQRIQHVLGAHLIYGYQKFFPSGFSFELSGGLGMKFNHYTYSDWPDGTPFSTEFTEWLSPVKFTPGIWNPAPSLYLGIKVGYCFGRRAAW